MLRQSVHLFCSWEFCCVSFCYCRDSQILPVSKLRVNQPGALLQDFCDKSLAVLPLFSLFFLFFTVTVNPDLSISWLETPTRLRKQAPSCVWLG